MGGVWINCMFRPSSFAFSCLAVLAIAMAASSAARAVADNVQDACAKSSLKDVCVETLSPLPGIQDADLPKMVAMLNQISKEAGLAYNDYIVDEVNQNMPEDASKDLRGCVVNCKEHFLDTVDQLITSGSAIDQEQYKDAEHLVSNAIADATACTEACQNVKDDPHVADLVKKSERLGQLCTITDDLLQPLIATADAPAPSN